MTIKEKNMSEEVKITKENLMKAYENGCDDVKKVLKDLCPREFGDGWKRIGHTADTATRDGWNVCKIIDIPEMQAPLGDVAVPATVCVRGGMRGKLKIEGGVLYMTENVNDHR